MYIKAYKVESDDEEGKNWNTVGYAIGSEEDIKKHFDKAKAYELRLKPIEVVDLSTENPKKKNKKDQYRVFYERDFESEKFKKYGAKMLFDKAKKFGNEEKAYEFASEKIPSLIIEKTSARTMQENSEYVVAARFEGKYSHSYIDGSSDPLTNYDVLRCKKGELENIITKFVKEGAEEIITGVELKLF